MCVYIYIYIYIHTYSANEGLRVRPAKVRRSAAAAHRGVQMYAEVPDPTAEQLSLTSSQNAYLAFSLICGACLWAFRHWALSRSNGSR